MQRRWNVKRQGILETIDYETLIIGDSVCSTPWNVYERRYK
jgi:hypothetical protein